MVVGSLVVKPVVIGGKRAKVVLLPGHEFRIEHFQPGNFTRESLSNEFSRVNVATSKLGSGIKFILRRKRLTRSDFGGKPRPPILDPASEARLARFLASKPLSAVKIEEPLAVILKPGGDQEVFYRYIDTLNAQDLSKRHANHVRRAIGSFHRLLKRHGLHTQAFEHKLNKNVLIGRDGKLHIIDFEFIQASPKTAKKLKLRNYEVPE